MFFGGGGAVRGTLNMMSSRIPIDENPYAETDIFASMTAYSA